MADFPGKVNTQTSSPQYQTNTMDVMNMSLDLDFIKSVPGILVLVEISSHLHFLLLVCHLFGHAWLIFTIPEVFGMLVWALISSSAYWFVPAFGWVLFVSITLWILTIVLFVMLVLGMRHKMTSIPWPLVLLVFYAVASTLYLTAFLANAVSVDVFAYGYSYNHVAAAAFFGICVTVAYAISTTFAYMEWKGDGGNAAMTTVPV